MRKFFSRIVPLSALVLMMGCANITTVWDKRGDRKTAAADLKACASEAWMLYSPKGLKGKPVAYVSQNTYEKISRPWFEKCMGKKGYRKVK